MQASQPAPDLEIVTTPPAGRAEVPVQPSPTPMRGLRARAWRLRGELGQTTTEYALILVVVAVIGIALFAVGPEAIKRIFGEVVDWIVDRLPG